MNLPAHFAIEMQNLFRLVFKVFRKLTLNTSFLAGARGLKDEPSTSAQLLGLGSFIRPYGEQAEKLNFLIWVQGVVYWRSQQNNRRPQRQALEGPPA